MLSALVVSRLVRQTLRPFLVSPTREDLLAFTELVDAGKLTPVIDRSYPLSETPDAIRDLAAGHARGKLVIAV